MELQGHIITASFFSPVQSPCWNNLSCEGGCGCPFPLEVWREQPLICQWPLLVPWTLFLLLCLKVVEIKASVFGLSLTEREELRLTPQSQVPANIQINTPWAVLSVSFFIIASSTTYHLASSSHCNRSSCSLPLAKTHVQQQQQMNLFFIILLHRMKNVQIHKCALIARVAAEQLCGWSEAGESITLK